MDATEEVNAAPGNVIDRRDDQASVPAITVRTANRSALK
jgi:hypothetical protein